MAGITLGSIRNKIEEKEKELEELKAAYNVMSRLLEATDSSNSEVSDINQPPLSETGVINIDELNLPAKAAKKTDSLRSNVQDLIVRFEDQEFTVNHVVAALRQMGKGSDAIHFKNRVSVTIKKLTEDGILERVFTGKGNIPNKYKRKSNGEKH